MQEFIGAFLSAVSYFLTSYFLYRILGGRRSIPIIFLSVLFISGLYSLFSAVRLDLGFTALLYVFMTQIVPVLVASFFFFSVTGIKPVLRLRFRKKLKELPMDILTKRQTVYVIMSLMGVAVIIGILGLIFSSGVTQILSFVIAGGLLIFAVFLFFKVRHITSESVILFVGKEKELVYEYEIKPEKTKVMVSDFYTNPMFIVDKIGEVELKDDQKKIEKHHLYWIATNSKVDMSAEKLKKRSDIPYREYLNRFEKYHFKRMQFSIGKTGRVEFIKETTLK